MSLPGLPDPNKFQGRFFIIHAMPRSATRSLRIWLDQQEQMICHGEVLGEHRVTGASDFQKTQIDAKERNNNPKKFIRTHFLDHDVQKAGLKILSDHFHEKRNFRFLRWFKDTRPKVIQLYRADLPARFRSAMCHSLYYKHTTAEKIQRLQPRMVWRDCFETMESWRLAEAYWLKGLDCLKLKTSDLGPTLGTDLTQFLEHDIQGEQGRQNAKTSIWVKENHPDLYEHLSNICADPSLDPFRNITL